MEVFKDVPGYEGMYQVSNLGNVKSLKRLNSLGMVINEKILKPHHCDTLYYFVNLYNKKHVKSWKIHQLVAMAFLDHKPCGYTKVVNHKNHNRQDNRVENLEIVTSRENVSKSHIKSSSIYVGVNFDKKTKKWKSQIVIGNKKVYLGLYTNEIDAHYAYQNKLKTLNNK